MNQKIAMCMLALAMWLGVAVAFTAALDGPAPSYIVHAN